MRLEGLGKVKKIFNNPNGNRTRDIPACHTGINLYSTQIIPILQQNQYYCSIHQSTVCPDIFEGTCILSKQPYGRETYMLNENIGTMTPAPFAC
jgi:hypothetical protein